MATNDKYDRQLRLWGAAGQKALGETCVILLRATAVGTETAKNLVLPGVGEILVVDDVAQVTTEYASNFFLVNDNNTNNENDDSGSSNNNSKSRAEMATEYLGELNSDVQCSWKHVDSLMGFDLVSLFATKAPKQILVVASDLEPLLLEEVAAACHAVKVPVIAVHAYGLVGIVRLQTPPLPLMNPKPRDGPPDLRLVQPFPALTELAESVPWEALESHQHGHVPYPLVLLKVAKEYKAANDGKLPSTFAEKRLFQEAVQSAARNFDGELNFQEAKKNAYTAYAARELDTDRLAELLTATAADDSLPTLHCLLQGLDIFLARHANQPPVQGTIPDMTASTELYVKLQNVYKQQADADLAEMRALIPDTAQVSDDQLVNFCQNVFNLDVLQPRTLWEEYYESVPDEVAEDLAMATMEGDERPEQTPLLWYLAFRACQEFYKQQGRYPGVLMMDAADAAADEGTTYQQDIPLVQSCIQTIVETYKLQENDVVKATLLKSQDYATEMTRYGNAEIHTIASLIGGVASQEAVKIITGQYVPFDNCYVFNGIASTGGVYRF
jgi:amyloid beta precursor protein binding protein 1